jgi:hypothetical protein
MIRNIVLLFTAFLFLLAACNSSVTPASNSGIEGQVLIGPMCPVVQVGTPCPDQPYQAIITVLNSKGDRVMQFQSDAQGRFRVALNPGTYTLHPESPNVLPFAAGQVVTVASGQFTQVVINYDSGIR